MYQAITRQVSRRIQDCELTHINREPIDLKKAREQHRKYEQALVQLGCQVHRLPEEPELPDSVFVEDIALVFPGVAVLTYPGADSRLPERKSIYEALLPWRQVIQINPPARLDGGDVLILENMVYVGLSTRSNRIAIDALQGILGPYGYRVEGVALTDCLHLKSAVTQVGPHSLLLNPSWVAPESFPGWDLIEVAPGEAHAANALLIGETVLYSQAFPVTSQRLVNAGIRLEVVDLSELAKAEGAVTCCSLIFQT